VVGITRLPALVGAGDAGFASSFLDDYPVTRSGDSHKSLFVTDCFALRRSAGQSILALLPIDHCRKKKPAAPQGMAQQVFVFLATG